MCVFATASGLLYPGCTTFLDPPTAQICLFYLDSWHCPRLTLEGTTARWGWPARQLRARASIHASITTDSASSQKSGSSACTFLQVVAVQQGTVVSASNMSLSSSMASWASQVANHVAPPEVCSKREGDACAGLYEQQ